MQSKRLRKKRFKGEFAILGFPLNCDLLIKNDQHENECTDEFLAFIESLNLMFGGEFCDNKVDGFICSALRYGSTTEQDRKQLAAWLNAKEWVLNVNIGKLLDANHSV